MLFLVQISTFTFKMTFKQHPEVIYSLVPSLSFKSK